MPEGMPPESYAGLETFERAKELFSGLDEEGRMAARAGVEVALKEGESEGPEEGEKTEEGFEPHMMYDPETGEGVKAETYEEHMDLKGKGWSHKGEEEELDLPPGMPMMIVIRKKAAHKACPSKKPNNPHGNPHGDDGY